MGEWIRNITLLNSERLTEEFLVSKMKELEREQAVESPETFIYYSPNEKWVYIYSNCLEIGEHSLGIGDHNKKRNNYQIDIAKISRHFSATAISNHVYHSSELVLAMSRQGDNMTGQDDVYVLVSISDDSSDEIGGFSSLRNHPMDVMKWSDLLSTPLGELRKALKSGESATDHYMEIGRCLGYDEFLSYFDYDHREWITQVCPDLQAKYVALRTNIKHGGG